MDTIMLVIIQLFALGLVYSYCQHYRPRLRARARLAEDQLRADIAWWRSVKTDPTPLNSDRIPVRRGSQTLATGRTKGVGAERQGNAHDSSTAVAGPVESSGPVDASVHPTDADAGRHLHPSFGSGRPALVRAATEIGHLVRRLLRPVRSVPSHRAPEVPAQHSGVGRHSPRFHADVECLHCVLVSGPWRDSSYFSHEPPADDHVVIR